MNGDMSTAINFTYTASIESLATRREVGTLNGCLSTYVGLINGIQLRVDEIWDQLGSIETEV